MKKILSLVMTALLMLTTTLPLTVSADKANPAPVVIPAIREWSGTTGKFIPDNNTILVNSSDVPAVDKVKGFFSEMLGLNVKVAESGEKNAVIFTLDNSLKSSLGEEGYTLTATEDQILIKAATNTGLLYGGITVAQSVFASGYFPCGEAVDYPAYPTRSGMLDVGRAWIPLDYVEEISRYMAWFKLNEIHLHINDDGSNNYSGFRLESDVKGLASKDGYYTKDEYRAYQKRMLEYGMTVVTEIDTPFHSRCYSNAENPPPYLPGNDRCLDISKPETLEFVKNLLAEYMTGDDPVFVNKVVHIGTDEYPREYAEEMRAYTDALIDYVNSLGYTPRFWGGLGPDGFQGETPISENAQMNYWDNGISGFEETMASDYDIINTVNMILYTVPTTNYSFPDYFDLVHLYNNWQVNMLAIYDTSKHMDPDDERLLGACFALWNDLHTTYHGVTRFDIFDRLRGMACLVSEKTWVGLDTGKKSAADFVERFEKLSYRAGDADPGRHSLPEEGINLDFESNELPSFVTANGGSIENGEFILDGNSYLSLDPMAVGFPNTLEFEITLDEATDQPIFYGDGVGIYADSDGKGRFGFKTEVYNFTYDYKIPVGKKVKILLTSDLKTTMLSVNDSLCYSPSNALNVSGTKLTTLTIPLAEIGKGIKGKIDNIKVTPVATDLNKYLSNRNLAIGAATTVSSLEVDDGRFTSDLAVDDNENTRLSFSGKEDEQWLIIDLGDVYEIARFEIVYNERISDYDIQVSENGSDYTTVYELKGGGERKQETDSITLESSVKARYVKYRQHKRWFHVEWNTYYSGSIREFRVFSCGAEKYDELLESAREMLETLDKNDPRRNEIRSALRELTNYLDFNDTFYISNADYYASLLSEAMNEPVIEESTDPEASEPDSQTDNKSEKSLWIPAAIGAAAGLAILAAAFIIIKRKKK